LTYLAAEEKAIMQDILNRSAMLFQTRRSQTQQMAEALVAQLNREMNGWANYFCLGPVSKAYRTVERHARRRLRHWLCAKHKVPDRGTRRYPDAALHEAFGLVRLTQRTGSFPWVTP
jgi:RNA-directed DNA polymerase